MEFTFLVDPTVRHNYIDPCFIEFFRDSNDPTQPEKRASDKVYKALVETWPFYAPVYVDKAAYEVLGMENIISMDGNRRLCSSVNLYFEFEGVPMSSVFYLDDSICTLKEDTNSNIVGVLNGTSFFVKVSVDTQIIK